VTAAAFDPIRPVSPITTIFISVPFDFVMCDVDGLSARRGSGGETAAQSPVDLGA
jgi:hypothetical protein